MQDAIDHFLSNFVLDVESLPGLVGGGSIEIFDILPAERGPGRAVAEVLDTLTAGLLVIRAASLQTIEGRRKQHVKYRRAMGELRESISLYPNSRALIAPIFLFALYEVSCLTVDIELKPTINADDREHFPNRQDLANSFEWNACHDRTQS